MVLYSKLIRFGSPYSVGIRNKLHSNTVFRFVTKSQIQHFSSSIANLKRIYDEKHISGIESFKDFVEKHKTNSNLTVFRNEIDNKNKRSIHSGVVLDSHVEETKLVKVKKVLIVGSGGLSIGQAGEFDYSGSQAIKALREENIQVILINPNIATIQTGEDLADVVYFLPANPEYVEYVLEKERPDGVLLGFGGQTALNCGVELEKKGVFDKYNAKVLGTQVRTLELSEDRDLFANALREIKIPVATSTAVESVEDALKAATNIGYPVIIRSAYSLGGLGSGFANNAEELRQLATSSLSLAPQILVEKSMKGWKEVEYEVVRDAYDNCITVCNMENFDPLGVHTGDSIVVAPSQTLSDTEYHMLRSAAIKIIRHLGVVGECNVQYALNPHSLEYCVIEVNARLSRSSALASKATGYPLAAIAAKLSLGHALPNLRNAVTKVTTANFEPSLDYVVTKIPRWDLGKFQQVDRHISSAMKSVGEVMAIGRTWEESLQKALRMVDSNNVGVSGMQEATDDELIDILENPTDRRFFAVYEALLRNWSIERINQISFIDKWFLGKLKHMRDVDMSLKKGTSLKELESGDKLLELKKAGFSDHFIANRINTATELEVRKVRKSMGIVPFVKSIDTLAGEFPAKTNYLYMTYHGVESDIEPSNDSTIVLGSGVYRIGSSVEFDWCGVTCIRTLENMNKKGIMINYNPETVSTDFDECSKLYFEELGLERVLDIYEFESPNGIISAVGGQLPQNIALELHEYGLNVLGTSPIDVDKCENRSKFSAILDSLGISQPKWSSLTSIESAFEFADNVGYPVLVRPSYVLSGAAMSVAHNREELDKCLHNAKSVSEKYPVVITDFIQGARELDIDAVAQNGKLLTSALSLHIEDAGVHSGDATLVLPPPTESQYGLKGLAPIVFEESRKITEKIAKAFNITGPFNMQLLLDKDLNISIIECNLRASRSFPFVSKVLDYNFIELATRAIIEQKSGTIKGKPMEYNDLMGKSYPYVAVKVPVFSWTRLAGADPQLGVEMSSTGEVACFGKDIAEAYLTGLVSNHNSGIKNIPLAISSSEEAKLVDTNESNSNDKGVLISVGPGIPEFEVCEIARGLLNMGYNLYADTERTSGMITSPCSVLADDITVLRDRRAAHKIIKDRNIELVISLHRSSHDRSKSLHTTVGRSGKIIELEDSSYFDQKVYESIKELEIAEKENTDLKLISELRIKVKNMVDPGYLIRRTAVDFGLGLINELRTAVVFVESLKTYAGKLYKSETPIRNVHYKKDSVRSWQEYLTVKRNKENNQK